MYHRGTHKINDEHTHTHTHTGRFVSCSTSRSKKRPLEKHTFCLPGVKKKKKRANRYENVPRACTPCTTQPTNTIELPVCSHQEYLCFANTENPPHPPVPSAFQTPNNSRCATRSIKARTRYVPGMALENVYHEPRGAADDPGPAPVRPEGQLILRPCQVLDRVGRLKEEIVRAGALSPVVRAHPVDLTKRTSGEGWGGFGRGSGEVYKRNAGGGRGRESAKKRKSKTFVSPEQINGTCMNTIALRYVAPSTAAVVRFPRLDHFCNMIIPPPLACVGTRGQRSPALPVTARVDSCCLGLITTTDRYGMLNAK